MDISDEVSANTSGSHGNRSLGRRRVCRTCGQHHQPHEPHVYDYVDEVDEDVTCHICLQPLVTPVDTPCGHTFCKPCIMSFLKVQQFCPIDRKPLTQKTCSLSSLVLKKLLEKLIVKCPNMAQCYLTLARGDLDDHLKYRCPGNWVACTYSAAGCEFRGHQKAMIAHSETCDFKDQGVNRTPIVEGEISYVEIPRTQTALGIAIVGGADTPLRCVVIQEVFPDGLISQDGRLQAGDQIIEIDGTDMTSASHHQICNMLRRTTPVMRLGIYRERIDAYKNSIANQGGHCLPPNPASGSRSPLGMIGEGVGHSDLSSRMQSLNLTPGVVPSAVVHIPEVESRQQQSGNGNQDSINGNNYVTKLVDDTPDELVHVTLTREVGRQLGIKLGGRRTEPGIFIMELLSGSVAEQDNRLQTHDRILAINGGDVRYARLDTAFRLIKQSHSHVSLIVSRSPILKGEYDHLFRRPHPDLTVAHSRTKSAPDRLVEQMERNNAKYATDEVDGIGLMDCGANTERSLSLESLGERSIRSRTGSRFQSNGSLVSRGKEMDNTSLGSLSELEPINQSNGSLGSIGSGINKSYRSLTSPIRAFLIDEEDATHSHTPPALPPRSRQPLGRAPSFDHLDQQEITISEMISEEILEGEGGSALPASGCADVVDGVPGRGSSDVHVGGSKSKSRRTKDSPDLIDATHGVRKSIRLDGTNQLRQKTVTISKDACESLGMRIGGGVNSNEGDTPIYIANIHPQGPVGKSKNVQKGDILLSVNGQSLLGLSHTQAVSLLKATAELAGVTLSLLEGPETSTGPANFVPSWLFWQKLPRALQLSKGVVLHRIPGTSLGFSIVGGSDPQRGCEPIHVLFVVATSPAAIDGRLRCGDRLLKVDGRSLESVSHAQAVQMLKLAGQRVRLELVSWMGTEI